MANADLAIESATRQASTSAVPRIARIAGDVAVSARRRDSREARGPSRRSQGFGYRCISCARELQPRSRISRGRLPARADRWLASARVVRTSARDLDLVAGDAIDLQIGMRRERFEIAAVLPSIALEDRAALLDIATGVEVRCARQAASRSMFVSRAAGNTSACAREIERVLPPNARLLTPGQSTHDALRLSRAYRANLTALALVALFTGGFLVYSTQTLAILRRRRELALLLRLVSRIASSSCTRSSRQRSSALSVPARALPLLAYLVARYALQLTGADLGAGYVQEAGASLNVRRDRNREGFIVLGILCSRRRCAVYPAWQAMRIATATSLKSGDASHASACARMDSSRWRSCSRAAY